MLLQIPALETPIWVWPDTPILIGMVIVLAIISRLAVRYAIQKVVATAVRRRDTRTASLGGRAATLLAKASGWNNPRQVQRTRTLGSLLTSVATFVIVLLAILTIMSVLGLPMGPLLTSAGIGGVALGFGAQSLVKDFLSGVFLIAEDQFGVGDVVDLGEVTGTIEEVGLRITTVRDPSGKLWYVRNGEIIRVGNVSQGWSNAMIDIPVHYEADPVTVIGIITKVCTEFDEDEKWKEQLLDTPKVLGIESVSGTAMTIRVLAKCLPNQHWGVQRELRERIKTALDAAGIPGPGPAWPAKA